MCVSFYCMFALFFDCLVYFFFIILYYVYDFIIKFKFSAIYCVSTRLMTVLSHHCLTMTDTVTESLTAQ